jgi:hypothetical protein
MIPKAEEGVKKRKMFMLDANIGAHLSPPLFSPRLVLAAHLHP